MAGTFFGIETARRGLQVHQKALNITGHNLANASTPGYSRQQVMMNATSPYAVPGINSSVTPGQLGTGVGIDSIRRVRDEYLDNSVRQSVTANHYWEDQISFLQRAEAAFAEPAVEGIGDRITEFFKAWMNLNNNPQDSGAKAVVVELGSELATMISSTYKQLDDVEKSIADINGPTVNGALADQVNRVNELLKQLKDLDTSIKKVIRVGQQPNDLLDKRDQILEELSQFGPVKVDFETVGVNLGGISKLEFHGQNIDLNDSLELFNLEARQVVDVDGNVSDEIVLRYGSDDVINLTANCNDANTGGSLLGLEKARQNLIEYKDMLDKLATAMADNIGEVGKSDPDSALDIPFFTGELKDGNFKVDDRLIDTPALIDGTMAGDIAALRDEKLIDDSTLEQHYGLLITKVGASVDSADSMAGNQAAITKQITALRDSVSGVAVDEELTLMLQYQYGFQASARMINTLDGMLDVIINRLF
ncbi:flagellar hook-associated protein FlgK [Desulfofalx alkaliphila]|uniref:flagellar hook-associated protein FlgK n=1 Tax=Desulfofalx alkaliphila TaxID=105483 RepID=UPI0004E21299|nr:flagellar hook-associated protein FlgK [Desulfofalx alkaliphila]